MADETLASSDQVRFRSANTGVFVLDQYLEAAERGGRTLGDMMTELFTSNGDFNQTIFQFRESPTTQGQIQIRVGQFIDPNEGWNDISGDSFPDVIAACIAAKEAAETARNQSQAARDLSISAKNAAQSSQSAANISASNASTSETNALSYRNKAEKWAEEAKNVPVEVGKFSAKHWATVAQEATTPSAAVTTFNNTASGSSTTNVQAALDELYAGDQAVVTANSTAAYTINLASGKNDNFLLTLTANCAITITNPTARGNGFTLTMKQDAVGGRTVVWPSSIKWSGGVAPTLTGTALSTDIFVFMTTDGGITWSGLCVGVDVK